MDLTEDELIELEGLVIDLGKWDLLKKIFRAQIDQFWDAVRTTDPADEKRIVTNQRLAVGVESSLGAIVKEMEDTVVMRRMRATGPEIIADSTKSLFE